MLQYIVFIGGAGQLFGTYLYIKGMLRRGAKPNLATWTLWCLAPMIAVAAALSQGVRWSLLPIFLAGFDPLLVILVALSDKKFYWRLSSFDYTCAGLSVAALIFWATTKNPNMAVALAIAGDALAGLPTIKKSWQHPATETSVAYAFGIISPALSFFAIRKWIFAAYALPIYFILMNSSLTLAGYLGRRRAASQAGL